MSGSSPSSAQKAKNYAMFNTLRRLHGQNLESKGLNDITDAFQTFVTRARFFSVGKLRRTWSHSAVEFMKYRRLLPMLLADGQVVDGMETDDFNVALAFNANATSKDDRRIAINNVPSKVTSSQLQSFFSQFGKVTHCTLPNQSKGFSFTSKGSKHGGCAVLTFKRKEDADKVKAATEDQLKLYDQVMVVSSYSSKKRSGKGIVMADDSRDARETSVDSLSRTSSTLSLTSSIRSLSEGNFFTSLPTNVLARIISFLPITDTICLERVNKNWMEASIKSWSFITSLHFTADQGFYKSKPLKTGHFREILRRSNKALQRLDLSGAIHQLDEKAIESIAQFCPNITDLDMTGVRGKWEVFGDLSEALTSLRKLAYRDMPALADKSIWHLIRGYASHLQSIDLRGCRKLHGRCTKLFSEKLEMLYFDGCSSIDSLSFEDLCTVSRALKEMRINECFNITDENLSMISRTMNELQVFTLCGDKFTHLSPTSLTHITRINTLTELALDFNPLVNDDVLISIANNLTNLRILSLANAGTDQNISHNGLVSLAKLTQLEQLDLSSIAAVRSGTLLEIIYACPIQLMQLRNCMYLSDDSIRELHRCQHLKHVDLSGSILITSDAIQTLIKRLPHSPETNSTLTIVVGGTSVEPSNLSIRGSRVIVDFSDYSNLHLEVNESTFITGGDDDSSDDEFETLTSQRSFYMDTVCGDEVPLETDAELQEWAEREARNLGLINKK